MGGMKADWLAQLAPAHAPPPPGWWPPAPGWWGLALLLLAAGAGLIIWWRRPTRRLRRAALREFAHLARSGDDDRRLARDLENLLRRYAVARFGRAAVARLAGDAWVAFVVGHGGEDWSGGPGRSLLRAAYGGPAAADRRLWLSGARAFLKSRK